MTSLPILELGPDYYDAVEAAPFPQCIPRFLNRRAAGTVGLGALTDEEWARHFCRFAPLPDNLPRPLALRYHGHQFRVYNPDIGDGRGFLFAQVRDSRSSGTSPTVAGGGTSGASKDGGTGPRPRANPRTRTATPRWGPRSCTP